MSAQFIGKYEVLSSLGRGSMGVVYKAKDPEIERIVAIKTLKSVYLGDDSSGNEALQRFKQESRSAGKLHHPNIVTIFEAGRQDDGTPFIVMEYVEGVSLGDIITKRGAVNPSEAFHYLAQIASAVDYAHSHGIIHRDLKPSNIIVDLNQRPYLLDFGVAKISDTSLTPAGTVVGTPSYMSPEQIRGEKLDSRTDVFSLAVVAYEVLTAVRPFPGTDFTTVVGNIIHKAPLTFADAGVDLPLDLEKVLEKGLSKDKETRSESALAFITEAAKSIGIVVDDKGTVGGIDPNFKASKSASANAKSNKAKNPLKETQAELPSPRVIVQEERESPSSAGNSSSARSWINFIFLLLLLFGGFTLGYLALSGGLFDADIGSMVDRAKELVDSTKKEANSTFEKTSKVKNEEPEVVASLQSKPESKQLPVPVVESSEPEILLNEISPDTLSKATTKQLSSVLASSEVDLKQLQSAIDEVGNRPGAEFAEELVSLTSYPKFNIRVAALKALSSPDYSSLPEVSLAIAARLNDEEYIVRGFAVKILSLDNSTENIRNLEARLAVETNDVVKRLIVDALAKIKSNS
jgi:serine/threonine protein kinase